MLKNKTIGFTLLEVIVVIVTIGFLASLALPRFFTTIEYSRANEGIKALSLIRQSIERCYIIRGYNPPCDSFNALDIEDPSNTPNTHFIYNISFFPLRYIVQATRNTLNQGDGTSTIQLRVRYGPIVNSIILDGDGAFGAIYQITGNLGGDAGDLGGGDGD